MAEFCYECYKKHYNKNTPINKLIIGKEVDICDGCGEFRRTVVKIKRPLVLRPFDKIILWLKLRRF